MKSTVSHRYTQDTERSKGNTQDTTFYPRSGTLPLRPQTTDDARKLN